MVAGAAYTSYLLVGMTMRSTILRARGGTAILASIRRGRPVAPFVFHDRAVVITSGSRGLSFLLAQRFAATALRLAGTRRYPRHFFASSWARR